MSGRSSSRRRQAFWKDRRKGVYWARHYESYEQFVAEKQADIVAGERRHKLAVSVPRPVDLSTQPKKYGYSPLETILAMVSLLS